MANVSVKVTLDEAKIRSMEQNTVRGLMAMGYDIAAQARANAPYETGALRNSIRVHSVDANTVEVIAGGAFGNKSVPYALRREYENNLHPDRKHYMKRAQKLIMTGDYITKYFGDITK